MNKSLATFILYFCLTVLLYILHCANIQSIYFFDLAFVVALIKNGSKPLVVMPLWIVSGMLADFNLQKLWLDATAASVVLLSFYMSIWMKKPLNNLALGIIFILANAAKLVLCVLTPALRIEYFLEITLGVIILYCFNYVLANFKLKGIRKRYSNEEILFIGVMIFSFMVGLSNTILPETFFFVWAFLVLAICFCFSPMACLCVSIMIGLAGAVSFEDFLLLSTCVGVGSVVACIRCDKRFLLFCGANLSFILFSLYFNTDLSNFALLSFVAGALVFCLLPRKWLDDLSSYIINEVEYVSTKVVVNKTRDELKQNLLKLSDVLLDMKNIYFNLAKLNCVVDLDYFAMELKKRVCLNCENRCVGCGDIENIKEVLAISRAKGKMSIIDAPPNLCAGCVNLSALISAVNDVNKVYYNKVNADKRRSEKSLVLSALCDDVSKIVHESATILDEKISFDTTLEQRIKDNLFSYGINCVEVVAYLKNNKLDSISLTLPNNCFVDKVLTTLFEVTHTSFEVGECADGVKKGFKTITFYKSVRFDILYGCYGGMKQSSNFSGDTFSVSRVNRKNVMFAISDGMGSGEKARKFSADTLDVIEDFFYLGLNSEFCITNVNNLLLNKEEEIFSALDIGVINLETGRMDILKMGSSISFIIRGNELIKLEPKAMPLGMLKEMKPNVLSYTMVDGDYVVFLSDGVTDSFEVEQTLENELRSMKNLNPQTMAKSIVLRAVENSNNIKKDDMTALVIRIVKKL